MSQVSSPQLGRLGAQGEGRADSQQSQNEVRDLQGRIRRYNRECLCAKGSFVSNFDIDHEILLSLTLLEHKCA